MSNPLLDFTFKRTVDPSKTDTAAKAVSKTAFSSIKATEKGIFFHVSVTIRATAIFK